MKLSGKLFGLIAAAVFVLSCASSLLGQSTATLSGTVTDPSGAVVPNAAVVIHSAATGLDRSTVTDSAGDFAAPALEPGEYTVTVTSAGFGKWVLQGVTLGVNGYVNVNAKLALATTGETVQVEGTSQVIETQTSTVGQVIDTNTVQNIPLNGRHFLDLTVLTPGGVVADTAGNLTSPSRGLGANSFITAGNREDSVNFQINGVNLNDMSQNQITFQPSINTTSEFKVINSTFSAEYGRSSGSIVNVGTRSGTNSFHGEAFDYFRNEALDARNYFNRNFNPTTGLPLAGATGAKAPLKRNNFGAAVGGPIWKNKIFFFGSYEGLRQHQGILQNSTVFSTAQRAAIVAAGKPSANAILPLIPVANSGNNYVAFTPGPVQIDQYTGDGLYQISPSDSLHGFYAFQSDVRTEPALQGDTVPGWGDHRNAHRQILTLNETHIFNPALVNEARLGFNRISIAFTPNTLLNPANYFIGGGLNGNVGLPQTTISDLNLTYGGPAGFPQGRTDTYGVFSDAVTYLRGKHSIKFGGEFRRFLGVSFSNDTGTLTFANTPATPATPTKPATPLILGSQNFANDVATAYQVTPTEIVSRTYINAVGLFIQDNYKVNQFLTLELGFRWEWNGTPTEGENRLVAFIPGTGNGSLVQTGTNGLGSIYKQNYNAMPRVGFAWDVFGTSKTVVRGGYGILSDQPVSGVVTGLASNPPFSTSVNYSNVAAPIPVSSLYNSAKASGIAIASTNPDFKNATLQTFNLNVQQAGPAGIVFSAGYYGSLGRHLRARTNQNQPNASGVRPYPVISSSSPIDPGVSSNSNISEANDVGYSNYNAMWLVATKNFGHGLEFNMNYNWSKSLDTNSLGSQGGYTFQDSTNPANNYGPSDFDVRQHYGANAIYNLPFKGNRFKEGFSLSTIAVYQTGNPVNLTNTSTFTGVSGLIRPNLVGPNVIRKTQTAIANVTYIQSTVCPSGNGIFIGGCSYFNTSNSLGNMSRNMIFGPGFANIDLSGEKDTKITERLAFKFRVDAFDILNHPNFGQPAGNTTSSTFGQISATRFPVSDSGSSRQLQISGKFVF